MFDRWKSRLRGSERTPPASKAAEPELGSDGKRRVFGEAAFAKHGEFLKQMGVSIDDPGNVIPDQADFDRMIRLSLETQDRRRTLLEAEMLATHGCNNVRPFFLFSEGVFQGELGQWLIKVMRLMPYDDWNITYLPMDGATAAALRLPLHPQQSIPAIEKLIVDRMSTLRRGFGEALAKTQAEFERSRDFEILERFNAGAERMRQGILEWAAATTPLVIELLADLQKNAG